MRSMTPGKSRGWIILALSLVLSVFVNENSAHSQSTARPIASVLNSDGTIKEKAKGSFDPTALCLCTEA